MIDLSNCCTATAHVAFTGPIPLTCWHVCNACGKPCDVTRVSNGEAVKLTADERRKKASDD